MTTIEKTETEAPAPVVQAIPPHAAFLHRDFRLLQGSRFLAMTAMQMISVAVGWQIFQVTHSALDLGYVGLAQFFPAAFLSLVTGGVADRFDRRKIVVICYVFLAACGFALYLFARANTQKTFAIYVTLFLIGVARAFSNPAGQALMPSVVPNEHYPNAVAWSSSIWQLATIAGPALGGVSLQWSGGASGAYIAATIILLVSAMLTYAVQTRTGRMEKKATSWDTVLAGVRYVWTRKVILGAISLDLFAVLLGGAVALLPAFADEILMSGKLGFGMLRAAPGVGAALVAILLAFYPIKKNAGVIMFICVAIFGVATIVFGYSRSFVLSIVALFVIGASDMVSVAVRQILVQLATPPEMRGRVGAVNMVFVGASNELGEFESGLTAAWFGLVRAVVYGGIGTLVVVGAWASMFPELRRVNNVNAVRADDD